MNEIIIYCMCRIYYCMCRIHDLLLYVSNLSFVVCLFTVLCVLREYKRYV